MPIFTRYVDADVLKKPNFTITNNLTLEKIFKTQAGQKGNHILFTIR